MLTLAQCDKPQRASAIDDPCSECRWYGGANTQCLLSYKSQNEHMWSTVLSRAKHGFALNIRQREYRPMDDKLVHAKWQGSSADELMRLSNTTFPDHVQECPRAYLVGKPRQGQRDTEQTGKRTRQESEHRSGSTNSSSTAQTLSLDPYISSLVDTPCTDFGKLVETRFDHTRQDVVQNYSSGVVVHVPFSAGPELRQLHANRSGSAKVTSSLPRGPDLDTKRRRLENRRTDASDARVASRYGSDTAKTVSRASLDRGVPTASARDPGAAAMRERRTYDDYDDMIPTMSDRAAEENEDDDDDAMRAEIDDEDSDLPTWLGVPCQASSSVHAYWRLSHACSDSLLDPRIESHSI